MTPEQIQALRQAAYMQQQARRLAARQQALAQQAAAQREAEEKRKQLLFGGLAALGGAALGYGALRLFKSEQARQKAGELLHHIGDECAENIQQRIKLLLEHGMPATSSGHPMPQQPLEGEVRDVEFRVLDEDDG
jgi:hypothetical protein